MTMGSGFMSGGDSRIPRRFSDEAITERSAFRVSLVPSEMQLLSIRLLGELSVVDYRGNALSVGSRRTQALVVYLALKIGGKPSIREISELLFGRHDATTQMRDLVRDLR